MERQKNTRKAIRRMLFRERLTLISVLLNQNSHVSKSWLEFINPSNLWPLILWQQYVRRQQPPACGWGSVCWNVETQ